MKLTILGNNGPYPNNGGACSGYLLSSDSGNTNIIIDFGTGSLAQLPKHIQYEKIDAIMLSHLHFDHMSDMLPLQYALQFHPTNAPVPVYAPKAPEAVRTLLTAPCYDLKDMADVTIGEMNIHVFPARHPVPVFAFRIECDGKIFGYTGDSNTIEGMAVFMKNCDLLLADAGLSREHWSEKAPHYSAEECGKLAADAHANRLLLTHLNPRYTENELVAEARECFANVEFTMIGSRYDI